MKKKLYILFAVGMMISSSMKGQVGIKTESPQATLDINGNTKIHVVNDDASNSNYLVLSNNNKINTRQAPVLKTLLRISGTGDLNSGKSLAGASAYSILNLTKTGTIDFDENNDFDNTNHQFVAPMDGVYNIYVHLNASRVGMTVVGLNSDPLALAIVKKSGSTTTILKEISYGHVGTGQIATTPPVRTINIQAKLKAGDILQFGAKGPKTGFFQNPTFSATGDGGGTSTYLTIKQVK